MSGRGQPVGALTLIFFPVHVARRCIFRGTMAGPRRNRSADVQVDDVPKKHRKFSDDDAADDAEDLAEEAEVAEEEVEEEEEEEDPIELLKAQGVSEDVAKRMLEKADGDLDAAVMLIVEHQELEKEEKI